MTSQTGQKIITIRILSNTQEIRQAENEIWSVNRM